MKISEILSEANVGIFGYDFFNAPEKGLGNSKTIKFLISGDDTYKNEVSSNITEAEKNIKGLKKIPDTFLVAKGDDIIKKTLGLVILYKYFVDNGMIEYIRNGKQTPKVVQQKADLKKNIKNYYNNIVTSDVAFKETNSNQNTSGQNTTGQSVTQKVMNNVDTETESKVQPKQSTPASQPNQLDNILKPIKNSKTYEEILNNILLVVSQLKSQEDYNKLKSAIRSIKKLSKEEKNNVIAAIEQIEKKTNLQPGSGNNPELQPSKPAPKKAQDNDKKPESDKPSGDVKTEPRDTESRENKIKSMKWFIANQEDSIMNDLISELKEEPGNENKIFQNAYDSVNDFRKRIFNEYYNSLKPLDKTKDGIDEKEIKSRIDSIIKSIDDEKKSYGSLVTASYSAENNAPQKQKENTTKDIVDKTVNNIDREDSSKKDSEPLTSAEKKEISDKLMEISDILIDAEKVDDLEKATSIIKSIEEKTKNKLVDTKTNDLIEQAKKELEKKEKQMKED